MDSTVLPPLLLSLLFSHFFHLTFCWSLQFTCSSAVIKDALTTGSCQKQKWGAEKKCNFRHLSLDLFIVHMLIHNTWVSQGELGPVGTLRQFHRVDEVQIYFHFNCQFQKGCSGLRVLAKCNVFCPWPEKHLKALCFS